MICLISEYKCSEPSGENTLFLKKLILVSVDFCLKASLIIASYWRIIEADLGSCSAGDQRLSYRTLCEHAGCLHIIPILPSKGILRLFLASLFPFADPLVLADLCRS